MGKSHLEAPDQQNHINLDCDCRCVYIDINNIVSRFFLRFSSTVPPNPRCMSSPPLKTAVLINEQI